MISRTTERFRKAYRSLPLRIQKRAKQAFQIWIEDPHDKSLHFKQIHPVKPIYSARVTVGWRAVGVKKEDTMVWFWIGSHADYDKLISRL